MNLYRTLMMKFHPDICKEPYALERAQLINMFKNDELQLRRMATSWGVIDAGFSSGYGTGFESSNSGSNNYSHNDEANFTHSEYNRRKAIRKEMRAYGIKYSFERCGLEPGMKEISGVALAFYKRGGYGKIIYPFKSTNEYVMYKEDGKTKRAHITRCYRT